MNASDFQEIFCAQVQALRSMYPRADRDLTEWGLWSRTLNGVFPALSQPRMWDQFTHDGTEAYGDIAEAETVVDAERKAERDEERQADEKLAEELDIFLHETMPYSLRRTLLALYVVRDAPTYQLPRIAALKGHSGDPEAFLTNLELCLQMVECR